MHTPLVRTAAAMVLAGAALLPASGAMAQAGDCAALRDVVFDGGHVNSARVVEATADDAAYCEVRATALPAINILVQLPVEGWNGKFYQVGCGGFCGELGRGEKSGGFSNAMWPGRKRGYATATSDSGHHGMSVVEGSWADHNTNAERDWGWRSIGETNRVAQVMVDAFYGKPTEQAIFQGCSTGGRMAHMASLRYPEMFQGIISGAPAMNETALAGPALAWLVQANTGADGKPILKPGKEGLIGDAVMKQCDGLDGTEDGLIGDPRLCAPDLSVIACEGGASGNQCLTADEIGVVEKWYAPAVNSAGEELFPGGIPPGSEPFWFLWLTGTEAGAVPLNPLFGQSFGAYMAFENDPGASWTPLDFDFDEDPARMTRAAAMYNADDPDISKFRAAGGKMIVWHGWADAIVLPGKTVDWFEKAQAAAGGADELAENVALYMIPGMDHCGILKGPTGVQEAMLDPLTAMESWLETGTAPEDILKKE